ncbi:hypothetical protein CK203_029981 [Vitis vinifera]|uniref:Uncharacterized protein n=1 Tax=Vitis vinifera TaxID=29760 RepID=A0A438IK71_VITVI|nr:hypothetical protein CK203_029981 [Vitis vinifera]
MPKHMPVVSAKLVNIVFRELHPDEDQAISYYLMTSGQEIHVDLVGREYKNVIDGEEVTITNSKLNLRPGAKIVPF